MKFAPKTDRDLERASLIEPGVYDFEVVEAVDAKSKKGNDMIKLKLKIFLDDYSKTVFDYLLEAMAYKFKHFCRATDMLHKYEAGEVIAIDCLGRTGKCEIGIDDRNPDYPPKNVVEDYVVEEAGASPLPPPTSLANDDIPF